ncbi:holo-ACP synthase [Actinoplanes sp. NPDC024001]|uniref:holo-ACP synthase n=1 Tax=Actinoplanes sp. NPDC024001 TaxID=3154598 RepID=UPI0033F71F64
MLDDLHRLLAELGYDETRRPGGDIGIGVDIEEVARWRRPDERLFTDAERGHCRATGRPAESYAGRWCAKEATLKAVSPFLAVGLRDVEIIAAPDGCPQVRLTGAGAGWAGTVRVSIAHSPSLAVAVAVASRHRGERETS